jgi:hypothetical protein
MQKDKCAISCIFGANFNYLYPAPAGLDCYFFSNNKSLMEEADSKGWTFIFVDCPISLDIAVSSFQSKYIKFLQFLKNDEFKWFQRYTDIIYIDHKFFLQPSHINDLLSRNDKGVLIRKTGIIKEKIWDEVNMAKGQERYLRFMPATIDYVNEKLKNGYSEDVRICNTGLIVYDMTVVSVCSLVDEVYKDLELIGTSECQIIWGMVCQKYQHIIQTIEWKSVSMIWKEPSGDIKATLQNNLTHVDVNLIRDAAIILEKKDINFSYKLMSLAKRKRPNGPLINEKLLEYKKKLGK